MNLQVQALTDDSEESRAALADMQDNRDTYERQSRCLHHHPPRPPTRQFFDIELHVFQSQVEGFPGQCL